MDPDSVNILLRPCLYGVLVRMAVKPCLYGVLVRMAVKPCLYGVLVRMAAKPCLYGVLVRMAVKPRWRLPVDLLRYTDACGIGRMSAGPTLVFELLAAELPVIIATSSVV